MRTDSLEHAETSRLALSAGVAVALGLILHRIFFLAAAAIALIAPVAWLIEWLHEKSAALRRVHGR